MNPHKIPEQKNSLLCPAHPEGYRPRFVRGCGCRLLCDDGRWLIDSTSGLFNVALGYSENRILEAINQQAQILPYLSPLFDTPVREQLADELLQLVGNNFSKAFICTGGAEAVEAAILFAQHITKRQHLLCLRGAYHGSIGITRYLSNDPTSFNRRCDDAVSYVTPPGCWNRASGHPGISVKESLLELEKTLQCRSDMVAAIIIEPIIGVNAYLFLPQAYLQGVKRIADKYKVLLIFDEVLTGFYRTGMAFAFQRSGVQPDIVCAGKILTNGYMPIGVAILSKATSESLALAPFDYGATHNAHPLVCSAALATLRLLTTKSMRIEAKSLATTLQKKITAVLSRHPIIVRDFRGTGLLYAFDLVDPRCGKPLSSRQMMIFSRCLFECGLVAHIEYGINTLPIAPAMNISHQDVTDLCDALDCALHRLRIALAISIA